MTASQTARQEGASSAEIRAGLQQLTESPRAIVRAHLQEQLQEQLRAVETTLVELRAEQDAAGEWQARTVAGFVEDLVDHTRRVMLPTASDHYRTEKVGVLVEDALEIQIALFNIHAGWPDEETTMGARLDALAGELRTTTGRIRRDFWTLIQEGPG